jgi:NAD(P)-dependent dehydrogenase (short-subunit alcohol dehydrogenase family)
MSAELSDLSGNVAFVSGASRGLGEHFAEVLANAGCDLVVTSRDPATLELIQDRIEGVGRQCLALELDVLDFDSIQQAADRAVAHFGKVDILVCNAGCNRRKPALEVTWDDWNLILDTNLRGSFFLAQAVAKRSMMPRGYGRVITIGSVTCVHGYAGLAPYGASRGGIKQLTMSLADDWGPHGITVNCLAPGWFKTAQNAVMYEDADWVQMLSNRIPVRRPGSMHDLDGALVFLASESSRYVTGQTLLVDGGISGGPVRALPKK